MKRIVLFVALLAAAVATVGAPRAADAATTYTATFKINNQTIGLTATTDATDAQITSVTFRVVLAPGECAKVNSITTSGPKVTVLPCVTNANLDKGEIQISVKVLTVDRTLRKQVILNGRPLSGGPYTFEKLSGSGVTNIWVNAVYVKN